MRFIANSVLLLTWVGAYLAVWCAVAQYRRTRAFALVAQGDQYRAERDMALRLITLAAGSILGLLIYLASVAISRLF